MPKVRWGPTGVKGVKRQNVAGWRCRHLWLQNAVDACQKGSQEPGHSVLGKDTGTGCAKISRLQLHLPKCLYRRGAINSINLINYFANQRKCCYQFFLEIVLKYFNPSDCPIFLFDLYFICLTVFIFINDGLIIFLVVFQLYSDIPLIIENLII